MHRRFTTLYSKEHTNATLKLNWEFCRIYAPAIAAFIAGAGACFRYGHARCLTHERLQLEKEKLHNRMLKEKERELRERDIAHDSEKFEGENSERFSSLYRAEDPVAIRFPYEQTRSLLRIVDLHSDDETIGKKIITHPIDDDERGVHDGGLHSKSDDFSDPEILRLLAIRKREASKFKVIC
jgi:hypothetical protein